MYPRNIATAFNNKISYPVIKAEKTENIQNTTPPIINGLNLIITPVIKVANPTRININGTGLTCLLTERNKVTNKLLTKASHKMGFS